MLALILVELIAAASLSSSAAEASPSAEAPATRRVCHDVLGGYSRTPRRVCTTVAVKQPAAATAPEPAPPPLMTALGVGMAVVDVQGGDVGVVTAVAADSVTVKTDKHEAQLPKSSLTVSDGKALFGLTQAALNASIERSLAATAMAALKVGAEVKDTSGASVGTIDAIDAANVTIKLASGIPISIPRSGIAPGADGSGRIGITAAQLEAQVKAAHPGS